MNKQQLAQKFLDAGLAGFWNEAAPHAKSSIRISLQPCEESELPLGKSKIGGLPDLPENTAWFTHDGKPLSFVAQLNFAETKPYDAEGKLPASGILYFFYDADQTSWGFDPADKGSAVTYYVPGDAEVKLVRQPAPAALEEHTIFKPAILDYAIEANVPDYWSGLLEGVKLDEEENDRYLDLKGEIYGEPANKLLGHSNNIQGAMELQCELVTNGLYCGNETGYKDPKRPFLEKNASQWQLLLQVDTNEACDMIWGDSGRLYFWIKEEDLQNRAFDRSWTVLQCY